MQALRANTQVNKRVRAMLSESEGSECLNLLFNYTSFSVNVKNLLQFSLTEDARMYSFLFKLQDSFHNNIIYHFFAYFLLVFVLSFAKEHTNTL